MLASFVLLAIGVFGASVALETMPGFPLHNAAVSGLVYPAVGLGTGGYGLDAKRVYPECWVEAIPGCGEHTTNATLTWLKLGGRRIDSANSYENQGAVRAGIQASGVPRAEIFITSKVGPSNTLGYADTIAQMADIKRQLGVDYVDLLLVHWPTYDHGAPYPQSSDPLCNHSSSTFNERLCRISTWRAMLTLFQQGAARAVGVANYNITHLQEIIDAGLTLPAVNQCPFHLHRSSAQQALVDFCAKHNILFNSYSPLGIPDLSVDAPKSSSLLLHQFPAPMTASTLDEPVVRAMATRYGISPAQLLLAWIYRQNIPSNPRTYNAAHMRENMNIFNITLTASDMTTLSSFPQDYCDLPDNWYECVPRSTAAALRARGLSPWDALKKLEGPR